MNSKLTSNESFKLFVNNTHSYSVPNAKIKISSQTEHNKHQCNDSLKQLESNSYSADEDEDQNNSQLAIFYSAKTRTRRSLPARANSLAWSSTTTSASGMPVVESVSFKQRSSSLKLTGLLNQNLLIHSNVSSKDYLDKSSNNTIQNDESDVNSLNSSIEQTSSCNKSNNKTSDYDSGESPNSSDYNSDTDKLQLKVN